MPPRETPRLPESREERRKREFEERERAFEQEERELEQQALESARRRSEWRNSLDPETAERYRIADEYFFRGSETYGVLSRQETTLRGEMFNKEQILAAALETAFEECASDEQRVIMLRAALRASGHDNLHVSCAFKAPSLPEVAPLLWKNRKDRKISAIDFLKTTYAEWYGMGLTQQHIRRLDKGLYDALHQRLHFRPEERAVLDLPTRKEMNDKRLAAAGLPADPAEMDDQERERLRLHGVARARAARAQPS